jgi:hypothetical protein
MRTESVGFVFSSTPLKSTSKNFNSPPVAQVIPVVPVTPVEAESVPETLVEAESVPETPVEAPPKEAEIPSTVPESLHPLAKINMDFFKGINMDVKQEALGHQINNITLFKEGVDILFHNLEFILSFSPFVNIKTNFRDNIKFITTTQNTDYTYVLSPLKLIDHILLSNRIATHLKNAGKTEFTEAEVVQLCTTLWAPVNVLAGDCLSTIHNMTAFYTRETLNMKSLNLDNLLNAATSLNKRTTSEMSASLSEIMNTYASLMNYEKLLQQNYTEFINVLNTMGETVKTVKTDESSGEILPENKPSILKAFLKNTVLPYTKTTGETLVSDLTERILDLEDMNNVSGSTIWAWTTELLATEANNLVTKSDDLLKDKITTLLITYIDAAGLDKFTNNIAKQAVRKSIPTMHQKIKTKLTNIITRSQTKTAPLVESSPVVDIDSIANLMTLKCAELDFENCSIEPVFSDNILADGIMTIRLTVKLNDSENHPISSKNIEMKCDNSSTVVISPQIAPSGDDGNVFFSISNTVAETVTLKALYDNKNIGIASVKFIPVEIAEINGSYFNNILNINSKKVLNTKVIINYPFKISNTKSSIITESKITDSEGNVTFYSFPANTQFDIIINSKKYIGNTNSSIIQIQSTETTATEPTTEPTTEATEPVPTSEPATEAPETTEPAPETTTEPEPETSEPAPETTETVEPEPETTTEATEPAPETSEPEPETTTEATEPETTEIVEPAPEPETETM